MNMTVMPGRLHGVVTAPPSKSHVHRLLIAAALCAGETAIHCPGENADIAATVRCLQSCGAVIGRTGDTFVVSGPLQNPLRALDCGESGSTLRFLLPLCAVLDRSAALTGSGRLPSRPNGPLLDALRPLLNGVDVSAVTGINDMTGELEAMAGSTLYNADNHPEGMVLASIPADQEMAIENERSLDTVLDEIMSGGQTEFFLVNQDRAYRIDIQSAGPGFIQHIIDH